MEESRFDRLLRTAAQQGTRREALGVLAGGALLLNSRGESEANDKAKRRKKRQRQAAAKGLLRPIAIILDNTAGRSALSVEFGDYPRLKCCRSFPAVVVPVGASQRFAASFPDAYLWIDTFYWLQFQNPAVPPPNVSAASRGRTKGATCCPQMRLGTMVVDHHTLKVGRPKPITMARLTCTVTRTPDTNYKNFTVKVAPSVQDENQQPGADDEWE